MRSQPAAGSSLDALTPEQRRLLVDFDAGKRAALARAISIVENEQAGFQALLNALHGRLGRAHRIGVTGPPGAGKSTLVAALIALYRARGERVGIIAVDPTSPFTGGALLGDRIRMNDVALDDGVFIRSMATRGRVGGLALSTKEVADVMDAFGFDRILVETVGVGQSELDIAAAADSTVVVLVPESGDSIQAMKAGLMEASDLFVINKSDRPGADRLAREVSLMLHLRTGRAMRRVPAHHGVDLKRAAAARRPASRSASAAEGRIAGEPSPASDRHAAGAEASISKQQSWEIPVLQTVAETGQGVEKLAETLDAHRAWLGSSGQQAERRRERLLERVRDEVDRQLRARVWRDRGRAALDAAMPELERGDATPYQIASRILERFTRGEH